MDQTGVFPFFLLSALLLCAGLYVVITRRNAVVVLMGIELMLNASTLNFAAFSALHTNRLDGQAAALFIIVLAAAEAAVALAILLNVYKRYRTVNLDELAQLRR